MSKQPLGAGEPEVTQPGKKRRRRPRAHPLARTGPWIGLFSALLLGLLAAALYYAVAG